MDYAMSNLQSGMSVGKNLIQLGFITQRDLLDIAKIQVERVVWGAIGTPNLAPVFMAKDLDNTVVRLSLDTPALLLGGLLNLKDRERLLELLGSLSRVMVLDRTKLNGLDLPPDLARVPSLINGRRTLLELSRNAAAEPVRLGAFVLFLKEMGWGHLQDHPELTTQDLLDLPLGNESALVTPAMLSEPLDETPETRTLIPPIISLSMVQAPSGQPDEHPFPTPPLFHSIQAASSPTHNIEHLSLALDHIKDSWDSEGSQGSHVPIDPGFPGEDDEDDQVLPPPTIGNQVPIPYTVESGQAVLPAPNSPVPLLRFPPEIQEFPNPTFGEPREEAHPSGIKWGLTLGLSALIGAGIFFGYRRTQNRTTHQPPLELVVPSADSQGGGTSRVATPTPAGAAPSPIVSPDQESAPENKEPGKATPYTAAPQPTPAPKTTPLPKPPAPPPEDAVFSKSYAQGKAYKATLPKSSWTLRLEIACQKETTQNAAKLLDSAGMRYYLLPIKMNDGKICTQIFNGSFKSREEAEAHVKRLPSAFLTGGNAPRPFQVSEVPESQ